MKLSTKIILPIILISALLILLAGCFGIPDDSPEYTPGTITGIIVAPCGNTTGESFSETSDSPEFWCYYCVEDWYLQAGVEVVLAYGEYEVATTTTDEFGVYTFTDVPPGKNYVITAYYPNNNIPLVKDVALELIEGGSFDAKNTDIVSTSLGLVVDFLTLDIGLSPEDISLDEVIADRPDFPNFPKFEILVIEVGKVLEECGNVDTDGNVQNALYAAAEEISGDAPGFTSEAEAEPEGGTTGGGTPDPDPDPDPDPCDGNVEPVITDVTLGGDYIFGPDPAQVQVKTLVVGETYDFCVYATDDDILSQELTYSLTIDNIDDTDPSFNVTIGTNSDGFICLSEKLSFELVGTYEVTVNVDDGCGDDTTWGPVMVVVEPTFTVTYNANDGTGAVPVDSTNYVEGANVTVLGQGSVVRDGYTFDGWNVAADGSGNSGTDYAAGVTFVMGTANVTLFAQWTCDPCDLSGWSATDVEVVKYQLGPGSSNPRLRASGTINHPDSDCLVEPIEINVILDVKNKGDNTKATFTGSLTLPDDGTFSILFVANNAGYNAAKTYELSIQLAGYDCTNYILVDSGTVIVVSPPVE